MFPYASYNLPPRYRPKAGAAERAAKNLKPKAAHAGPAADVSPTSVSESIRKIGQQVIETVREAVRYLGNVEFMRGKPATVAEVRLKEQAYLLSLPTGSQLLQVCRFGKLANDGSVDHQGQALRTEIAEKLDAHNRLIIIHNELGHRPFRPVSQEDGINDTVSTAVGVYNRKLQALDDRARQLEQGIADRTKLLKNSYELIKALETQLSIDQDVRGEKIRSLDAQTVALRLKGGALENQSEELKRRKGELKRDKSVSAREEIFSILIELKNIRKQKRGIKNALDDIDRKRAAIDREDYKQNDDISQLKYEYRLDCQLLEKFKSNRERELNDRLRLIEHHSKNLRAQIKPILETQYAALDSLLEQAATAETMGSGHAGELNALRNALRDPNTLRGLRTDWRHWEMLGVTPAEHEDAARNPEVIEDWLKKGFSAKEALSFKKAGFEIEQVRHLRGSGIGGPLAKKLAYLGYTREFFLRSMYGNRTWDQLDQEERDAFMVSQHGFVLGDHHEAWAEDRPWIIGRGLFNAPVQGHFMDGNGKPGSDAFASWVFKKEQYVVEGSSVETAQEMGAQIADPDMQMGVIAAFASEEMRRAPRLGARNVACWRLAQKLGWNEIVETEFATSTESLNEKERKSYHKQPAPQSRQVFGIMMRKLDPVDPKTLNAAERVQCRSSLMRLQLLDHIIGQPDRHKGNIIFTRNSKGEIQAVGIDNDQAFPDKLNDPNILARGLSPAAAKTGLHGVVFPEVIDTEMHAAIMGLTKEGLRDTLRGLLTDAEIQDACARLLMLQEWVGQLKMVAGACIAPDGWDTGDVENRLRDPGESTVYVYESGSLIEQKDNVHTSYYARLF